MALEGEPADGEGVEHVLPRMEAVLRFTQELNARLAENGVDGIGGALALYRRLREALDAIPDAEVERMREQVRSLAETLAGMSAGLEEIRRLKTLVRSE